MCKTRGAKPYFLATVRVKARIGGELPGHVFIPFHYGYWDEPGTNHYGPDERARAANELTLTAKVVKDAARELRDDVLRELSLLLYGQNQRQQAWVDTMIKESAAQLVVVPS